MLFGALVVWFGSVYRYRHALTDKDGLLVEMARQGHAGSIQALITDGANPNARDEQGRLALYFAIEGDHADAVKSLLDEGADPNQPIYGGPGELSQWYPLGVAARRNHHRIAALLLAKGADANKGRGSCTPLHQALGGGAHTQADAQMIGLLLRHGADVNDPSSLNHGATPLHLAVMYRPRDLDSMALLLRGGARFDIPWNPGETAFQLAVARKEKAIVDLMLGFGAKLR
jgi:ankyrin repeat protein